MAPWSQLAAPIYENTGSVARDHPASERIYLAWTRTGLGFVALGIAVERFSRLQLLGLNDRRPRAATEKEGDDGVNKRNKDNASPRILLGILLGLGAGSILYVTRR